MQEMENGFKKKKSKIKNKSYMNIQLIIAGLSILDKNR